MRPLFSKSPRKSQVVEDTGYEYQPTVRAGVLYRRPKPFKALELPPGSDFLDLYRPKSEVAISRAQAEDAMEVDDMPIEDEAQFVLGEQRSAVMDERAWRERCIRLERLLRASEDEKRRMKQQLVELEEEMTRKIQALEEQNRLKEDEAKHYRKKYEGARTELHNLRRSTHDIVSDALQAQRTSSPSPI